MTRRATVRVPASSANLGPGFDTFAAALGLWLEVEVVETGSFAWASDLAVPPGRENLCVRAFASLAPVDAFAFRMRSDIPLSGGLGSSAAATLAGLAAAAALTGVEADLLAFASSIEGHPDNAAAALHGGFVVCADGGAARLDVPGALSAIVVVPGAPVSTSAARAALEPFVPRADAVFNVAHGALLAVGIARGDLDLVARGLADRLHQEQRGHLFPRSLQLVHRARELGALGATISGAGPAVLVWCVSARREDVLVRVAGEAGGWASVMAAPFEARGLEVEVSG